MKFYTSVEQAGNRLLVRGYENGNRFNVRVPFTPTLFLPTKKYSEWKTLEGEWVEPHKFGSIQEAREFIKNIKKFLTLTSMATLVSYINILLNNILRL